jgi:hypothetical protein
MKVNKDDEKAKRMKMRERILRMMRRMREEDDF